MNPVVPPVKCQGIKTKLVYKIYEMSHSEKYVRWVEPFMGSGVVAFSMLPRKALLCDTNPYLIAFYSSLKSDELTAESVRVHLTEEGSRLREEGEKYYYYVRDRFNNEHSPLDFLFLNRSCFNGVMRFNSKGRFNVPFCRKPERFTRAYITKIVNQVKAVKEIIKAGDFEFVCQDFRQTFASLKAGDFLYCDPPYIDRHTDYFNQWNETDETALFQLLSETQVNFILSTWKGNEFRENRYIPVYSEKFHMETQEHFYHIGGAIENRHAVSEALFRNYTVTSGCTFKTGLEQAFFEL